MMWSILPVNPADNTGMAASKTIDFTASLSQFVTAEMQQVPVQPAAADNPIEGSIRSVVFSGSILALGLVASSLY